ncbi:MAG: CPBP family intramembrane glutamic endopeptidase [Pseudomonadota bacterium]
MRMLTFLLATFGVSWAIALGLHGAGGLAGAPPPLVAAALLAYMFGPAVGAVLATALFDRGAFLRTLGLTPFRWGRTVRWVAIGWGLPLLLIVLATSLILVVLGAPPADAAARLHAQASAAAQAAGASLPVSPEQLLWLTLAVNLPVGIVINTVLITFNEELGWRGWLYTRLAHLGFWRVSLITGLLWGLWHAPIVLMGHNYPGLGLLGVALMIAWTVLFAPYFTLVREGGGNIWAAGAMHGAVNAGTGIGLLFVPTPVWPHSGLLGAAGFAVLLAGWGGIAWYRQRAIVRRPEPDGAG